MTTALRRETRTYAPEDGHLDVLRWLHELDHHNDFKLEQTDMYLRRCSRLSFLDLQRRITVPLPVNGRNDANPYCAPNPLSGLITLKWAQALRTRFPRQTQ